MKYVIIAIILFIILLSQTNLGQNNISDKKEAITSNTITKVYVRFPNFKVLNEASSETITVIKNADIPINYEATLIQLQSDNLDDLVMIINNLEIKKVFFFKKDIALSEQLKKRVKSEIEII